MSCPLYDHVRLVINNSLLNDPLIGRAMTLEDALGAVESVRGKQQQRTILHLTSKLLVEIDFHRHL